MKKQKMLALGLGGCLLMLSACQKGQTTQKSASVPDTTAISAASAISTERYPIQVSNEQSLVYQYTNIQGLDLEKGSKIAMVVHDQEAGYWKAVYEGARQAIDELNKSLGYKKKDKISLIFEGPKTENDVNEQVNLIDSILAENPAALCLSAVDIESCSAQLETARDNDIPVIILDSGVNHTDVLSVCRTDSAAAARLATGKLCDRIGNAGEIAIFRHDPQTQTSIERLEGFNEEAAKRSGISVAARLEEDEIRSAYDLLKDTLQAHPDLKGLYVTSELMSEEVLSALKKLGREDIVVVGMDSGKAQKKAVKSGAEYGFVTQDPRSMGYVSVVAAVRAADHAAVDNNIFTGYYWVDQTNIDSEEMSGYLYD